MVYTTPTSPTTSPPDAVRMCDIILTANHLHQEWLTPASYQHLQLDHSRFNHSVALLQLTHINV